MIKMLSQDLNTEWLRLFVFQYLNVHNKNTIQIKINKIKLLLDSKNETLMLASDGGDGL